jgi:hypothetical protein
VINDVSKQLRVNAEVDSNLPTVVAKFKQENEYLVTGLAMKIPAIQILSHNLTSYQGTLLAYKLFEDQRDDIAKRLKDGKERGDEFTQIFTSSVARDRVKDVAASWIENANDFVKNVAEEVRRVGHAALKHSMKKQEWPEPEQIVISRFDRILDDYHKKTLDQVSHALELEKKMPYTNNDDMLNIYRDMYARVLNTAVMDDKGKAFEKLSKTMKNLQKKVTDNPVKSLGILGVIGGTAVAAGIVGALPFVGPVLLPIVAGVGYGKAAIDTFSLLSKKGAKDNKVKDTSKEAKAARKNMVKEANSLSNKHTKKVIQDVKEEKDKEKAKKEGWSLFKKVKTEQDVDLEAYYGRELLSETSIARKQADNELFHELTFQVFVEESAYLDLSFRRYADRVYQITSVTLFDQFIESLKRQFMDMVLVGDLKDRAERIDKEVRELRYYYDNQIRMASEAASIIQTIENEI